MHVVLQLNMCTVFQNSDLSKPHPSSRPRQAYLEGQTEPSVCPGAAGTAVSAWLWLGMQRPVHPFPRWEAGQVFHLVPQMDGCPAPENRGKYQPPHLCWIGDHFYWRDAELPSLRTGVLFCLSRPLPNFNIYDLDSEQQGLTPGECHRSVGMGRWACPVQGTP